MNSSDSKIERLENGYPLGCDHLITTSREYNEEFYLWESRSDASDAENSIDAHAQSNQASSPRSVAFGSPFSDASLIAHIDAAVSDGEASQVPLFHPLSRQVPFLSDSSSGYDTYSDSLSIISHISSFYGHESMPTVPINNSANSRPHTPLVPVIPIKVHYTRNFVKNAKMLRFNPQGKVHNTRSRTRVEQIKLEELCSGVRT